MIKLGVKVRDVVSGAEGVLMCRCEWLNGCVRSSFQPVRDKDGKVPEMITVDDEQLEAIDSYPITLPGRVVVADAGLRRAGGGRNDAAALRR